MLDVSGSFLLLIKSSTKKSSTKKKSKSEQTKVKEEVNQEVEQVDQIKE